MKAAPMQPMDLGDIVSAAWFLCVHHASAIFAMATVTLAATLLWNVGFLPIAAWLETSAGARSSLPHIAPAYSILFVLGLLLLLFNQLAFIRYALDEWSSGNASIIRAYAVAARGYPVYLVAEIITWLVCALLAATTLLLPVAIYFLVSWFFCGQVCAAEGERNGWRCLRRSHAIVRGSWWRSSGILGAVALLSFLPTLVAARLPAGGFWGSLIWAAIAAAIAAPFLAGAQTRLYLDLRVRKNELISPASGGPPQPL
jgi:hypothetical protein